MLNKLWSFIKLSFYERMYLYVIEVFSLILFGLSPFIGLAIFLVASMLLAPPFTSLITSQFKFLFLKKYEADQRLRNEVTEIARRIGVRIKKVYVVKGLCNAFVCFGTLVLGEELLKRLGPGERSAVIAHELGHMKEKHIWFKMVVVIGLSIPPLWIWLRLYWPIIINELATQVMVNVMVDIALLSYLMVMMVLPNWYMEIRADRIAVGIAGKACLISALLAIVTREKFELPSEDHPAVSERIKLILKYNPSVA